MSAMDDLFTQDSAAHSGCRPPTCSALGVVLDACCGSRMMWMDKEDSRVTFQDRRNESYEIKPDRAYPNGTTIHVRPDVVADFTAMPFPDASFWHVVFDPPHIIRNAELGTVTKKYGCLNGDWKAMLAGGFRECFRVLKPNGTLIFKWCETQIPLRDILALTPEKPLYGHKGGQKSVTHWVAFLKQNPKLTGDSPV
jgi:ubiquinone/menaquinone biosynthesis C-methylase UbiE